jgi:hypothetical protein
MNSAASKNSLPIPFSPSFSPNNYLHIAMSTSPGTDRNNDKKKSE